MEIQVQSKEQLDEFIRLRKIIHWYFKDKVLIYPEEWLDVSPREVVAERKEAVLNRVPEVIKRNMKEESFFPQEGLK